MTKIKNKVYNDIMMIILSEEGEEIIIRVKTNTDEEIIDEIAKIRGEIITDEMRRVIKIKRERKEGGNEYMRMYVNEGVIIYKIEIEEIRIRSVDKEIVGEIKEIVEKKKGRRGILKYRDEIMDVNYTLERYLDSGKINKIEFIEIEE